MPLWRDKDGNEIEWSELDDSYLISVHLMCCDRYAAHGSRFWSARMDDASREIARRGLIQASLEERARRARRKATIPNAAAVTVVWGEERQPGLRGFIQAAAQSLEAPRAEPQVGEVWRNVNNGVQYTMLSVNTTHVHLLRAIGVRPISCTLYELRRSYERMETPRNPEAPTMARTWDDSEPLDARGTAGDNARVAREAREARGGDEVYGRQATQRAEERRAIDEMIPTIRNPAREARARGSRSVGFGNRCAAHNNLACGHCAGTAPKPTMCARHSVHLPCLSCDNEGQPPPTGKKEKIIID